MSVPDPREDGSPASARSQAADSQHLTCRLPRTSDMSRQLDGQSALRRSAARASSGRRSTRRWPHPYGIKTQMPAPKPAFAIGRHTVESCSVPSLSNTMMASTQRICRRWQTARPVKFVWHLPAGRAPAPGQQSRVPFASQADSAGSPARRQSSTTGPPWG